MARKRAPCERAPKGENELSIPDSLQEGLQETIAPRRFSNKAPITESVLRERLIAQNLKPSVPIAKLLDSINRIKLNSAKPMADSSEEIRGSTFALKAGFKRFHGSKFSLRWFPFPWLASRCADRFGYMSKPAVRAATRLPFNAATQALLGQLGGLMGDPGRDPNPDSNNPADPGVSNIPAGFTYFGQFVDHDITLDVSSSLDAATDANTIHNMRTPALDLDSVYGRGPALDPFLYSFPTSGPSTAIRFQLGTNTNTGPGGPSSNGTPGGMVAQTQFDVPRILGTDTAVIGDPRNDENLIVSQFHHAMLRFHNKVIELLLAASFPGDIFAEAKRIVTHHYQWAVVNDFLKRICGAAAVANALATVIAPHGSSFRMPVEFSVAAYRFGHSMVRDRYWVNHNFPAATLAQVFEFNRPPRLPVFSNWVVDFNALFDTGGPVPVNNKARRIDTFMATGLESLPGFSGMMSVLATRNLLRGLAMGLPSGQGMAKSFGILPLTSAQLTQGLPAGEVTVLNSNGGVLLQKTPLWYYVLREAAVIEGGNQLGPAGARIVAETFVRLLKRDVTSFVNVTGGFTPFLPSALSSDFTVADLVTFAGVTHP